jgi:hypothetical protein
MKNHLLLDSTLRRLDPLVFRSVACVMAAAVSGTEVILGGAYLAPLGTMTAVIVGSFLFPARSPRNTVYLGIYEGLMWIGVTRWFMRLAFATILLAGGTVLNSYFGGDLLGQEYSLFLIVVFVAALLCGLQVAIIVWLISLLLVYYYVVPPKNSFEINSIKDFADLIGYFYLGLAMIAIAVLIRASSAPTGVGARREDHHRADGDSSI